MNAIGKQRLHCLLIILGALLCSVNPLLCAASETNTCAHGNGAIQSGAVAGFQWEFKPKINPKSAIDSGCRILVHSAHGKLIFRAEDIDVSLESVSGQDVNGDGKPDMVFLGYSGGAHCCWTYWVVSLGDKPGLLKEIQNTLPAEFRRTGSNNSFELWTHDGAFDYFHDLAHSESFFPDVVLCLDGADLNDVSVQHWSVYQSQIDAARKQLTPDLIRQFRSDNFVDARDNATAQLVLTIVLEELYGGRPQDAWRDLNELWPPKNAQRVRREILKARREGVLSCVGEAPMSCSSL